MTRSAPDPSPATRPHARHRNWQRWMPLLGVVLFGAALWALQREISRFRYSDFLDYIRNLSHWHLSLALAAAFGAYAILVAYDWLAIRYVGRRLSVWRISLAAFVGYAFSMNIGHAVVSGGAVRMRLYPGWGFNAGEVSRVIGFNAVITMIGQCLVMGLLFTTVGLELPENLQRLPDSIIPAVGVASLAVVAAFVALVFFRKAPLRFRNWQFSLPRWTVALPAIAVAALDWSLFGLVLYALMPTVEGLGLAQFLGIFMLAQVLGIASMVPGGVGVFETVIVHLLPDNAPSEQVLSALIAFRAIYYIVPFILAILLLAGYELATRGKSAAATPPPKLRNRTARLAPRLLSAACFAGGAALLISGASPPLRGRMVELSQWLPLPAIEAAHFLTCLAGLGLMLVSDGLRRRVRAAFPVAVALLLAGLCASLAKGLDYQRAAVLGVLLLALLPIRHRFHRTARLFAPPRRPGRLIALLLVLAVSVWIGFDAFAQARLDPGLWLKFDIHGDAARFLRASGGIVAALALLAFWHLPKRRRQQAAPTPAASDDLEDLLPFVADSPDPSAWLVFLGDKRILRSQSGKGFLMYGVSDRTWASMGDPVGPKAEQEDLIREFRELCAEADVNPAFYQIGTDHIRHHVGLGLAIYQIGEDARIDLAGFSLDDPAKEPLRHACERMENGLATFEIVPAASFAEHRDELRRLSDDWLAANRATEKAFSLGRFDDGYLGRFDIAVIRIAGRIVAFANLLKSGSPPDLSIDLVRHSPDAPDGIVEHLLVRLILWGKAEGCRQLSLGMAPLPGIEGRTFAPIWKRAGTGVFALGEHFQRFEELRHFKEQFGPEWSPRYLACRGLAQLPDALLDCVTLVGGEAPDTKNPPTQRAGGL